MSITLRLLRLAASACMFLVAAGCAHVNHLREAQDSFNQAAALENRYRFDPKSITSGQAALDAAVQQPMAIETGYSAVVVSLQELDKDSDAVKSLRADKLYGNALTLKAMAYWRLHKSDQAKAAALAAQAEGLDPGSRDGAFAAALPGLIKNDQAYALLYGPRPQGMRDDKNQRLADIGALIDSAEIDLAEAGKALPDKHPMRVYLAFSGLAALKNLSDACALLNGEGTNAAVACFDERRINCRAQKLARTALTLGADVASVRLVGEGTLSTDPTAAMPAGCE